MKAPLHGRGPIAGEMRAARRLSEDSLNINCVVEKCVVSVILLDNLECIYFHFDH